MTITKHSIKNLALGTVIALLPWLAHATQTPQNGVLANLYEQAQQHDAQFAQERAQWEIQSDQLPLARANLLPNIVGKARYGKSDIDSSPKLPTSVNGTVDTQGYDITLTMPLYNHGAWQGLKAAKKIHSGAQFKYDYEKQSLMVRVTERYFDVLKAQDTLNYVKAEQVAIKQQAENAQDFYDVGMIAQTDLLEIQAASDLTAAQLIQAQNAITVSELNLSAVTGGSPTIHPFSNLQNLPPLTPDDVNHWVDMAKKNNLGLKAARDNVDIKHSVLKAQKSQHYPSLNLMAQHKHEEQTLPSSLETEKDTNSVFIELNVPIFTGGKTSATVKNARSEFNAAKQTYQAQERLTEQGARQAYLGVKTTGLRIKALEKALQSSKQSEQAVTDGFEAGSRTSTDILKAKRDRLRTERDLQHARYDYWLNTLRLKQVTGTLNTQDLPF